jgi:hypothetical protein
MIYNLFKLKIENSLDDCTRYYYIFVLRSKDKTLKMFKHYKNKIDN